jgi:PelA/Pel-15E family pectate lyase
VGALAALLLALAAGAAAAQQKSPLDSISRLPGASAERDTTSMLAPARLAALPPAQRAAWRRYLARSRELHARDSALMAAELRALGRTRMVQAPYTHAFAVEPYMRDDWFRSDSARALAENLLSWQTPAGGWSKHVDMRLRARRPGESWYGESDEWHYIGTFDNDATTTQLRIIGGVAVALGGRSAAAVSGPGPGPGPKNPGAGEFVRAFLRGLRYVFDAQYPNGCFPQVYPLQGGYHDAVTFNDNVTVNVLRLLHQVADSDYGFVPVAMRRQAGAAFGRGIDCVLRSQVVVKGVPTVWGQQHDPLTLRPAPARSYELPGLAGRESAWLLDFLMALPAPAPRVVAAVHAGAAWFRAHEIRDSAYGADQVLRTRPGAGPIWARNTEIATMRPIFANRDGLKLYDWNRLTDRRSGYGWFGTEPAQTLRAYEKWAREHPIPAPSRTRG